MNEYQKQFDLFCKIVVRAAVFYYIVGLLPYLPNYLSDKIVAKLLGMIGL